VIGEGEHRRLAGDKLWGDTQRLEGWGASRGPQTVAQRLLQHSWSLVEMSWKLLR